MKINELANIINGEFVNKPFELSVENFAVSLKQIKQNCCFFAFDEEDALVAVELGVFAVVLQGDASMFWHKNKKGKFGDVAVLAVKSIKDAVLRLVKFFLMEKRLRVVASDWLILELFSHVFLPKNIRILNSNPTRVLFQILEAASGDVVVMESEMASKIALEVETLTPLKEVANLSKGSFFFTTFEVGGAFFKDLAFARIFAGELGAVVRFLQTLGVAVRFKNLREFGHFRPLFLNANLNLVGFGEGQKVIVVEEDERLLARVAAWLRSQTKEEIRVVFGEVSRESVAVVGDFRYLLVHGEFNEVALAFSVAENEGAGLFD